MTPRADPPPPLNIETRATRMVKHTHSLASHANEGLYKETQGMNWERPHQQEAQDTKGPMGCYWIHGGDYLLLAVSVSYSPPLALFVFLSCFSIQIILQNKAGIVEPPFGLTCTLIWAEDFNIES